MKHYINTFIAAICLVSGAYSFAVDYTVADLSIVNFIKQKSDLTESDVNKYKLLFLGDLGGLSAYGATGYGAYVAGKAIYDLPSGIFTQYKLPFVGAAMPQVPNWATNKYLWAGLSAGGVALAVFPTLYYRTQQGILEKVKKFAGLCSSISLAKQSYYSENDIRLEMNPLWAPRGVIAWCAALDNLIEQSNYAVQLLEQLESWGVNITSLAHTINQYHMHLAYNRNVLNYQLEMAMNQRALELRARRGEKLQDLVVSGAQAGVASMQINNVAKVWGLLKDITATSGKVLKYGYENKEAIGTAIAGTYLYNWWNK